jgi:general nucleoside transport system permease protein
MFDAKGLTRRRLVQGVGAGATLFYAAPFVLTLAILVATVRPGRAVRGMPGELSIAR